MKERIAVIGAGYVGLVSAACYAEIGHRVVCLDCDEDKIRKLRNGEMPIYEPGLDELVGRNAQAERLSFTTDYEEAVRCADIAVVAVGTPPFDNGEADLRQLYGAAESVARQIERNVTVVIKSTVPAGTAKRVEQFIHERQRYGMPVSVVSNPEFLREGSAIQDTLHPERVVIGTEDAEAGERIARLHEPFGAPVVRVSRESAELLKYAANAFLATKISFINEMANICERVGADIADVAAGMGMDRRIGPHFLRPGIGFGGSCFPKDTRAQLKLAEQVDYDFRILRSVIEVNRLQRERFAGKVIHALGGIVDGKSIAIMGLAFKPNTDDLRDAPALDIIARLEREGAAVRAYDPAALPAAGAVLKDTFLAADPYEALCGADAMVVATEWEQIKRLDMTKVKRLLRTPIVVDGRNCFDPARMAELGFDYRCVGRPLLTAVQVHGAG